MNFPTATADEWSAARDCVFRSAVYAGHTESDADDMAQNAIGRILKKTFKVPVEGPLHAARVLVKHCRRVGSFIQLTDRGCVPHNTDPVKAIRNRGGFPSDPQWLAERAESMTRADRVKAMNKVLAADSMLEVCIAAAGIGPEACIHEVGHSPSVFGSGPGHDMPTSGMPGLHMMSDPNPARTLEARREESAALDGENLAAYRQQLAAYYG